MRMRTVNGYLYTAIEPRAGRPRRWPPAPSARGAIRAAIARLGELLGAGDAARDPESHLEVVVAFDLAARNVAGGARRALDETWERAARLWELHF